MNVLIIQGFIIPLFIKDLSHLFCEDHRGGLSTLKELRLIRKVRLSVIICWGRVVFKIYIYLFILYIWLH